MFVFVLSYGFEFHYCQLAYDPCGLLLCCIIAVLAGMTAITENRLSLHQMAESRRYSCRL